MGSRDPHVPRDALAAASVLVALGALGGLTWVLDPGPASLLRHTWVVPVVAAAARFGAVGGGLTAAGAVLLQAPLLFPHIEVGGLSASVAEDLVAAVTILGLGPLVGALAAEARRQRRRYETALALQRVLAEEAPLQTVLGRLRACLLARLGATELGLAARDGDRLVTAGDEGAVGHALAGVLEAGAPVFVPDTGEGPRPRRLVAVPLIAHGEVVGALGLEREGELAAQEREALAVLGLHLGLALENARLLARQRRFTEALAERVAAATERLATLDRAKSAFVAVASHELRTPLTALLGFSELLARREFPSVETRRLAEVIRRETERLARIVDDLLDLSRLEQGLPPALRPAAVAPAAAVAAAVEIFRRGGGGHGLVIDCPDGLPAVRADPDALDRILKNLIANALKYSPAGTTVTVGARAGAGLVEFAVTDEGRGIPAEVLPRIFEPYYRAPEAAGGVRGAGLGLAVVKALVEAQGGAIRVASAPGRGTRVSFTLPPLP